MSIRARLLLGMLGLTLAVPNAALAGPRGDEGACTVSGGQPLATPPPQAEPLPHHHRSLFSRRHCVECQRAYAKAHDGVDIAPPPPIEPGMVAGQVAPGAVVYKSAMSGAMMAGTTSPCPTCGSNATAAGPVMIADGHAPGYAVVGGPGAMASANAPGYAVVGEGGVGFDPAPIGVSRSGQAPPYGDSRMAAMGVRPGTGRFDASITPTGAIPPAQVAVANPEHTSRAKVIAHVLGVPKFGQRHRDRAEKERQKHAAIAYDQPGASVTELPASMVYGQAKR